ncbi:uncharacterized protein LOC108672590, partial [Hyalella azteca]|uniref:Uncharacterized protein LOC108672590 n=1 Tax=Hyalella azteca TaxID=294128 RepID=A0A8B7NRT3_HYAAZ
VSIWPLDAAWPALPPPCQEGHDAGVESPPSPRADVRLPALPPPCQEGNTRALLVFKTSFPFIPGSGGWVKLHVTDVLRDPDGPRKMADVAKTDDLRPSASEGSVCKMVFSINRAIYCFTALSSKVLQFVVNKECSDKKSNETYKQYMERRQGRPFGDEEWNNLCPNLINFLETAWNPENLDATDLFILLDHIFGNDVTRNHSELSNKLQVVKNLRHEIMYYWSPSTIHQKLDELSTALVELVREAGWFYRLLLTELVTTEKELKDEIEKIVGPLGIESLSWNATYSIESHVKPFTTLDAQLEFLNKEGDSVGKAFSLMNQDVRSVFVDSTTMMLFCEIMNDFPETISSWETPGDVALDILEMFRKRIISSREDYSGAKKFVDDLFEFIGAAALKSLCDSVLTFSENKGVLHLKEDWHLEDLLAGLLKLNIPKSKEDNFSGTFHNKTLQEMFAADYVFHRILACDDPLNVIIGTTPHVSTRVDDRTPRSSNMLEVTEPSKELLQSPTNLQPLRAVLQYVEQMLMRRSSFHLHCRWDELEEALQQAGAI